MEEGIRPEYANLNNYPNPFNASTAIRYSLSAASPVSLSIYNILGRHVRTLVDQPMSAGDHELTWDGKDKLGQDAASGVYLIVMRAGEQRSVHKAVMLR